MTNSIDGLGASGAAGAVPEASPAGGLNKDEFLNLLVSQLKNQDPLNPVGSQEFMSQMAAFSTLEQVTNLAVSGERLNQMMAADQSVALIGHQVSYTRADGSEAEGAVERVSFGSEGFSLTIGGESGVLPGAVTEVR